MADNPFPVAIAPLTVERVEAAFKRRGLWKACETCSGTSKLIVPPDNEKHALGFDLIDFWSGRPYLKYAAIGIVCSDCGRGEYYDYVLLNRFVTRIESDG
jgi:hypothetical protein